MPKLFHHTLTRTAANTPQAPALGLKDSELSYENLHLEVRKMAAQFLQIGLEANARVAVYLPKQYETVISFFAASMAGGVFVPVNPVLKGGQVNYILQDCDVSILITSLSRYQQIQSQLELVEETKNKSRDALKLVILTDCSPEQTPSGCLSWQKLIQQTPGQTDLSQTDPQFDFPVRKPGDIAAILYTSGSTGNPKGVVLSHNNLIAGAKSVAEYLQNRADDRLLAVLPFSFDYGLSQLTTAFISGGCVVLMEYLLPRDVIQAVATHRITGLAAVPPLWIQLAQLDWPEEARQSLRYLTNSGGAMPQATLERLMRSLPETKPFLMYGLTEAFRSTYLEPDEIARRPTSIGKAIPGAEILVINRQGKLCLPDEKGELVHRGPHVALGYWNAPDKTAERFRPLPPGIINDSANSSANSITGEFNNEIAVWSGDTVIKDEQGFLYFVGRSDDMIKSSGYRISPSEVEDCVYQHDSVAEVAAIGIPHPSLGQAIVLVIKPSDRDVFDEKSLLRYCQKQLPGFMQPKAVKLKQVLPRNPNGKIDRRLLTEEFSELFN